MSSKRSVVGTGGTRESIGAVPPDPGARSGILAGASFAAGVAALSLADAPYPHPVADRADSNEGNGGITGDRGCGPGRANNREEKMTHVVFKDELPHSGSAHKFEGYQYSGADVSFFISDTPPGKGPSLHTHPYAEVFVVQEGELTFTVGVTTVGATEGQIVVVPAGTPHKFVNPGTRRARHIDIHTRGRMSTEWLVEG